MALADLIERDIAARGLRPGDPYLNTIDTARMLKVNTTHANKALQLLVQRRRLRRKQRLGTIVADPAGTARETVLHCVHLLVHQNYLQTEGLLADGVIVGMQQELPGVNVRFNFLPAEGQTESVERVLSEAMRSSEPEGFVLVRSSLDAQRLLAQSGLPTVVFGSLHPSVTGLSRIDRDQRVIGEQTAGHLTSLDKRRVLVLMRDRMLPGDHPFLDGIRRTLALAGLGLDAVTIRNLPADREAIAAEVANVIGAGGEPWGIIARSEPLANGAARALAKMPVKRRKMMSMVISDVYRRGNERAIAFPFVASAWKPEEIGHRIGRMLAAQVRSGTVAGEVEIIPTQLCDAGV